MEHNGIRLRPGGSPVTRGDRDDTITASRWVKNAVRFEGAANAVHGYRCVKAREEVMATPRPAKFEALPSDTRDAIGRNQVRGSAVAEDAWSGAGTAVSGIVVV